MLLLILFQLLTECFSYKFLVYSPLYGHSHSTFMGTIADILQEAGNEVTVLLPVINENFVSKIGVKSNAKTILVEQDPRVKILMEKNWKGTLKNLWTVENDPWSFISAADSLSDQFQFTCDNLISNSSLLESLRLEKFDVGIAEPKSLCAYGLFDHLDIPSTISAVSNVQVESVSWFLGEPFPTSYVPSTFSGFGDSMSLFHRFKNTLEWALGIYLMTPFYEKDARILTEKLGKDYTNYGDLLAKSSLVFTNSNPYLDYPRPVLQKTIPIGGVTIDEKQVESLDKKWDEILNEREQNVYISFGSVAKSKDMPEEWKKSLLSVFSSLPNVTFIWKYEEETEIAAHLPNVYLSSWLPQNDLLADPRLSLFITHGGLGSTTELAHLGKPAIMIPIFGDQSRNAAMLARHGGAIVLQKQDIGDKEKMEGAIRRILDDQSYSKAAQRLAKMLREQPLSPKEILISHAEFVAKFGPLTTLDPAGRHLNLFQYYLADVVFFVILALSSLIFVPIFTWKIMKKFMYSL